VHGGLEHDELERPGREAARSAVGVQLAQDGDERVVCRVHGEIVEVAKAAAGDPAPPPAELEAGGAQEQRVQALDGVFVLRSCT
jgi:hypothetical protein